MMKKAYVGHVSKIRSRLFEAFELKFLKLWRNCPVSVVYERMPSKSSVPYVVHERTHEMVMIVKGGAILYLDGTRIKLVAGDYMVIPPGIRHRFDTNDESMTALSVFSPPMDPLKHDARIVFQRKEKKRISEGAAG